ncbi:MAG: tRNA pseudouridine(38-40) synthase TruA [Eubacteriales bacterium]|jgi:tRNA pseudouridine38-40 synthase
MKLVLRIAYLGTNYCGWQVQPNGVSIQQKLGEAAARLFCRECDIVGCSRTDSGVHANDFCLSICEKGKPGLKTDIDTDSIVRALNTFLPEDIAVKSAEWREDNFHPRYDVKYKEYIYRIYNARVRSPFEAQRALFYPYPISGEQLENMSRAAAHFIGRHDFAAFMASVSDITNTHRTVISSEVFKIGDIVLYSVAADGFLYNMVRIMAGTLLEVAEGKIKPDDLPDIIASRDRRRAGRTLPACGLYLNRVVY